MQKIKGMLKKDISRRTFWVLVVLAVLVKLALARCQCVYTWIDGAPLDDELMFKAAQSITAGQWLGDYNWMTLSKHMFFAVWLASLHALHIPYLVGGQALVCLAALACAQSFAPVLVRHKSRLLLFCLLAFNPATSASFTLRVYRDNIFPALCLLFFAGIIGWALRYTAPLHRGLPWLLLAGVGLGLAWITREDGVWLLPFALVGGGIVLISILRRPGLRRRALRCAVLAVPFAVLAGCVGAVSALNESYYGVFTLSDFSSGPFAAAFGAMTRIEQENWQPLVSVPTDVRQKLYAQVPQLAPLEYWLEESDEMRNGYFNEALNDYQTGAFYWVLRRAAQQEGIYASAQKAAAYWQGVADSINALCEDGLLPAALPKRTTTTPPIRREYILPVLRETGRSLVYTVLFRDCEPSMAKMSIGQQQDLQVWEQYLYTRTNGVAVAGTADPYYSAPQKMAFGVLNAIRWGYTLLLTPALLLALALQIRLGWRMLRRKKGQGLLLWLILLGVLGMALFRTAMIAFVEVASFNIGTFVMYLSTVHPLLILFAAVGILTGWPGKEAQHG